MPAAIDLEKLYDDHGQALFAYLLNLTRNEADTRDVLQDLFLKLAREPSLLQPVREPRAFLIRLAHNRAIDLMRRSRTRQKTANDLAEDPSRSRLFAPCPDPDEAAFRQRLAGALATLPLDQRAVVHLKLWEGLTFQDIAETLDIPMNTAASRYRYGLDKLRQHLRPLYDEITG